MKTSVVIAAVCAAVATALPTYHHEHHGNSTTGTVSIKPNPRPHRHNIVPAGTLFPNTTVGVNVNGGEHKHHEHEHHKLNVTHITSPGFRLPPRDQRKALSDAALRA